MKGIGAPKVRHLIKYLTQIIFDVMKLEQFKELLFKIPLHVMFMLVADIIYYRLFLRTANAECSITLLP